MKKFNISKFNFKKVKKRYIIGGVLLVVVLLVGSRFFLMRSRMKQMTQKNNVVNATVETKTIQTAVSGTGTISYAGTTDITLPSTIVIDELLVSEGNNVTAGQIIATVDSASLALSLSEVEEAIAQVDETIASESSSTSGQTIKAGVAGRVKKIYADEDDNVAEIMKKQGALMLISADGLMQVSIEKATGLSVGSSVQVTSGDNTVTGTVESVDETKTVVIFDDSVFAYEETVTVEDTEGNAVGTGNASIHQEIIVVASGGTISSLNVSLNSKVSASTNVFTLTSSAKSAQYMQAVREREQLVELLNTLVSISVDGGISAPVDGMLQTVNTSGASESTSNESFGGYMMGSSDAKTETTDVATVDKVQKMEMTEEISEQISVQEGLQLTEISSNSVELLATGNVEKEQATPPFGLTGGEGFIYGTTTDMEYADKEDASEWKACEKDKTAVEAGVWYVRVKETDALAASEAVKVEVFAASEDAKDNADKKEPDTDKTDDNDVNIPDKDTTTNQDVPNDSKTDSKKEDTDSSKKTSQNTANVSGGASFSRSYSSGSTATTSSESSTSLETTSMFTIANGEKMIVTMNVDELDIGTMVVGQKAEITLDAIEDETFTGEIVSVSGNASSSGGSSQYPVEIVFDKTDAMLSGMNASVNVIIEEASDVMVIPLSAITDDGSYSYVYTKYDEESGTLSGKVQVETGLSDETNVEVKAGLNVGDTIYYEMQGSEDSRSSGSGFGGFEMPGGSFPGGDFPSGDFPSGGMPGGNRGSRGMGGR